MSSNRWGAWEPQSPSPEFAARTAAALVRDRRRRQGATARLGFGMGAVGAVLVAGGAWAFVAHTRQRAEARTPEPAALVAPPTPAMEAPLAPASLPPDPLPNAQPPAVARPPHRPKVEVSAPAKSVPDAGHKVIVPRCNCVQGDGICDCF